MLADRGRQRRIGGTREDFETLVVHTLSRFNHRFAVMD